MHPRLLPTLACLVSLVACGEPKASIALEYGGETIYSCDDATVSELNPAPGGWAFKCSGGGSVYFIYETGESPRKGKLKRIDITLANGENRDVAPAQGEPTAECERALAGIDVFPTSGRAVEPGEYAIDVVQPCGSLTVTVGPK
jgi:hypothetical protein